MKIYSHVLLLLMLMAAGGCVAASRAQRQAASLESAPPAGADGSMPAVPQEHAHAAGAHMKMTGSRPVGRGDAERADEVARVARHAVKKYEDYKAALRDGYRILQPGVPQSMYHFNNTQYYMEAERRFNPEHPTSLLYEKTAQGYRLIGVMYTAPAQATEDELNERIPLSVAAWHQHVNICLPQGDPLQKLFGQDARFGIDGSITTREECVRAGGQFIPQLFGWMVHLYPYERTAREMWSVERQMSGSSEHVH